MKIILIIICLSTISFCSCCQKPVRLCNRNVELKSYNAKLIKEVCIPNGYWISELRTSTKDIDIDGDGLNDFIFDWNKPKLQDGDTLYVTVYKMNSDSTYSFFKTFNNLLPIYLKSYDFASKNDYGAKIFECYADGYPLNDLTLQTGLISLTLRIDAASGYLLEYSYKPEKKNWYLTTYQEWIDMPDGVRKSMNREIPEKGESIDEFSYQKYLCPELFPVK
jgi:hypothetical protein